MRVRKLISILACLLLGGLSAGALDAPAYREPLVQEGSSGEEWLVGEALKALPEQEIEGACGLAISPVSDAFYVSDYYHRAVHAFTLSGKMYLGSQALAGGDPFLEINELDAACGLAADASGALYANEFHQRVLRLRPSEQLIDSGESTGVAVDAKGDVYVDDRTYVAVYDAPIDPGEGPAQKIGLGSLGDAYGVAVDSTAGKVYVADAADNRIEVYEPEASLSNPVATIDGPGELPFGSLVDASLAVDGSAGEGHGHLLVAANLKPLFERPEAAVYEFDANGEYLDRLQVRTVGPPGELHAGPVFGEPSGIAVDPASGRAYVTTGNSERSNVVVYGAFEPLAPFAAAAGGGGTGAPGSSGALAAGTDGLARTPLSAAKRKGGSEAVIVRRGPVQVSFNGRLTPQRLPRHGAAPVGIAIDARISATGSGSPPQLRRIAIAINRNGHFASQGLPACRIDQIQPSTTSGALAACRASLVGEGHFSADVKLPEQSPFPSEGKVLAFNGKVNGKPAILAHIYGTHPAPTSAVLPFVLGTGNGAYGTTLEASLPQATGSWGYVTGLRMNLRRSFNYRGKAHSYLSAGCPAPAGFPSAIFPLAHTTFSFAGGPVIDSVLSRSCKAKGP